MLILFVGDPHLTGKNPLCRLDDLTIVQWKKWNEIINIANMLNIPMVTSGDILNVSVIANSLLTKLGNVLNKLNNPIYFIWGNHDLMYHSLDMWERTSLGVLWTNNEKVKHISEFEQDYGISWDYCDYNQEIVKTESDLLLIHKAVITEKQTGKNSWILKDKDFCTDLTENKDLQKYRLILCGHWHYQYVYNFNNTRVINAGSLVRRTVDETRIPTIQLVNIETGFTKRISLESAVSSDLIISKKHLDSKIKVVSDSISLFVDQLENNKMEFNSNFLSNIMSILDTHEIEKGVERFLRDVLSKVMELKVQKGEKINA